MINANECELNEPKNSCRKICYNKATRPHLPLNLYFLIKSASKEFKKSTCLSRYGQLCQHVQENMDNAGV